MKLPDLFRGNGIGSKQSASSQQRRKRNGEKVRKAVKRKND